MNNNIETKVPTQEKIEAKLKEMLPDDETICILGHRMKRKHFTVLAEMIENDPFYVEEMIKGMKEKSPETPIGSLCAILESDLE